MWYDIINEIRVLRLINKDDILDLSELFTVDTWSLIFDWIYLMFEYYEYEI